MLQRHRSVFLALLGTILAAFLATTSSAAPLEPCLGDGNGDRRVTVNEVVEAVNNLLRGCPQQTPIATATARPTPTPQAPVLAMLAEVASQFRNADQSRGCNASQLTQRRYRIACDFQGLVGIELETFATPAQAQQAFADRIGDETLSSFEGFDAFETQGEGLGVIFLQLVWQPESWVIDAGLVTGFPEIETHKTISQAILSESRRRGLLSPP